jgi:hypothetical protein
VKEVRSSGCALALAPARTHGYIAHGTACCPVPLAALAEVARLVDVVVVVVAKLGVHAVAPGARQDLVRLLELLLLVGRLTLLLVCRRVLFS